MFHETEIKLSSLFSGAAPLTAVQLLWVNLIMDTLGALALATEPPNDGLMERQPVGRKASFITKPMWRNIFGQSLYQLIVLGVLNFEGKRLLGLSGPDSTAVLNTLIFNSFVLCQVKCLIHLIETNYSFIVTNILKTRSNIKIGLDIYRCYCLYDLSLFS